MNLIIYYKSDTIDKLKEELNMIQVNDLLVLNYKHNINKFN